MLDAPEAARSYSSGVRAGGYIHWGGGTVGHCGCCEGAEESGQEGHGEVGEGNESDGLEDLQIGGCV